MMQTLNYRPTSLVWTLSIFMLALTACTGPRVEDAESINSDQEAEVPSALSPEPEQAPAQIPEILQQAEFDLGLALETSSEWMIHDESVSSQPVSLSELLLAAQQHYENGNHPEGERLALLVSEFARLVFEQHTTNQKHLFNEKNLYSQ